MLKESSLIETDKHENIVNHHVKEEYEECIIHQNLDNNQ